MTPCTEHLQTHFLKRYSVWRWRTGGHFCSDSGTVDQTSTASKPPFLTFILYISIVFEDDVNDASQVMTISRWAGMTLMTLVRFHLRLMPGEQFPPLYAVFTLPSFLRPLNA
jgi:hypothetical protein